MRFPCAPPPQFLGAREQLPFWESEPSRPMVRRRYLDGKKVLLVDPAHDSGTVHCGGTLGGLSATRACPIMRAWQRHPSPEDSGLKHRVRRVQICSRHRGKRNDLLCPTALLCSHAESLVAGMCPKSGGFLLPY